MSALAQKLEMEPCSRFFTEKPSKRRSLGGLIALLKGQETALPLAEVKVRAEIAGHCCRTVIDQRYVNTLSVGMEATHIFPLPEDGAVIEVELRCADLVVKAECKEKEEAEEQFQEARRKGHRAALLTQEREDVHTLKITNLPPKEEVTVRIVVVERLEIIDGEYRWRFPTTIAPRYLPGQAISHEGAGTLPDSTRVPDASRLQPPLRLEGGTNLDMEVQLAAPIHNVACSLHAVRMTIDGGGIRMAPSGKATLNKDFIVSFSMGDDSESVLRAWTDGTFTIATVEPPLRQMPKVMPRDAVFVVDISGSMGGGKLRAAKRALTSALHGLLPGDRFKLIAFDDRLDFFRDDFIEFNDYSLKKGDHWINKLRARGGTEMLPAVKAALDGKTKKGRLRTVLFVTDGQAWNENELCSAIAYRRKRSRFFTVGIDTAVNGSLLKAMARAGGGTCELATPNDDIEALMGRIEERFGSPIVSELHFEGGRPARDEPRTLFTGRPVTVLLEGSSDRLRVKGQSGQGEMDFVVKPARVNFPLGALWARERVRYLEDRLKLHPFEEESIRPNILNVALKHGIASRYTAFIAVEESSTYSGQTMAMVQPAELPEAWEQPQAPGYASAGFSGVMATSRVAGTAAAYDCDDDEDFTDQMTLGCSMDELSIFSLEEEEKKMEAPKGRVNRMAKRSKQKKPEKGIINRVLGFFNGADDKKDSAPPKRRQRAPRPAASMAPPPMAAPGFSAPPPTKSAPTTSGSFASGASAGQSASITRSGSVKDFGSELARAQSANGSFGGDQQRTIAALLVLILSGHTRMKGLRRRTVFKAAGWLKQQSSNDGAWLLDILAKAEAGETITPDASWQRFVDQNQEGQMLQSLLF